MDIRAIYLCRRRDAARQHLQAGLRSSAARVYVCQAFDDWTFLPVRLGLRSIDRGGRWRPPRRSDPPRCDDLSRRGTSLQPVGILEVEQNSKGKIERNDRVFAVLTARRLRPTCRTSVTFRCRRASSWSSSSAPRTRSRTSRSSSLGGMAPFTLLRPSSDCPDSLQTRTRSPVGSTQASPRQRHSCHIRWMRLPALPTTLLQL
jgi:hypothetical protein